MKVLWHTDPSTHLIKMKKTGRHVSENYQNGFLSLGLFHHATILRKLADILKRTISTEGLLEHRNKSCSDRIVLLRSYTEAFLRPNFVIHKSFQHCQVNKLQTC